MEIKREILLLFLCLWDEIWWIILWVFEGIEEGILATKLYFSKEKKNVWYYHSKVHIAHFWLDKKYERGKGKKKKMSWYWQEDRVDGWKKWYLKKKKKEEKKIKNKSWIALKNNSFTMTYASWSGAKTLQKYKKKSEGCFISRQVEPLKVL